jgi:hypothetical protein
MRSVCQQFGRTWRFLTDLAASFVSLPNKQQKSPQTDIDPRWGAALRVRARYE